MTNSNGAHTKLQRTTLVDQLAQGLVTLIDSRHLQPGDALPSSADIATSFGVSRPVVREAFQILEAQGIIEVANGKRATVKPISADLLTGFFLRAAQIDREVFGDLIEIRKSLEVESARLAAQRRTPEQLAQMCDIVSAMRKHLHDVDAFTVHDVRLHLVIAEATHNRMLHHLIESVHEAMRATIWGGHGRRLMEEQLEEIQKLHEALVHQLALGDPTGASRAMEEHFNEIAMSIGKAETTDCARV